MKSKKKAKKLETNDEDDQEKDLNDEKVNEQKDEFNCCGIRHKRLDDLIAKVGLIVHVVIMLMDFYRNRWAWWLNLASVLCYLALIYGISQRRWFLYLPYFCLNPILVITQLVLMLRTSYHGHNLDEGVWTAFINFITLTVFILIITTVHVASAMIILMRFQPFTDYIERKKQEKRGVLAEYPSDNLGSENDYKNNSPCFPSIQLANPFKKYETQIEELDRPPQPPVRHQSKPSVPRVKFSPKNDTYYYVPSTNNRNSIEETEDVPKNLKNTYFPSTGRTSKSFII